MSLGKFLFVALIVLAGVASFSGAAYAVDSDVGGEVPISCCKCKAVSVNGQVLQTCPCTYIRGGKSCNIQHDECETVGHCDLLT